MRKDDNEDEEEEEKIQMTQKLHRLLSRFSFATLLRIYHDKTGGSDYHSGRKLKLTRDLEICFLCTPINITHKQNFGWGWELERRLNG